MSGWKRLLWVFFSFAISFQRQRQWRPPSTTPTLASHNGKQDDGHPEFFFSFFINSLTTPTTITPRNSKEMSIYTDIHWQVFGETKNLFFMILYHLNLWFYIFFLALSSGWGRKRHGTSTTQRIFFFCLNAGKATSKQIAGFIIIIQETFDLGHFWLGEFFDDHVKKH